MRWKHQRLGMFHPLALAPFIEGSDDDSAMLVDFSLEQSIACVGRWLAIGRELRVAVNLSARAFHQLDLPERIAALAPKHRVPNEMITIEVTKT